jgi:Acetoacetate decarboxylase (ADC)
MKFEIERGKLYRMPVPYGPMPGPRQVPAGKRVDHARHPKRRVFSVSYLVKPERLEALLPPCFKLWGDPVLTLDVTYMAEIDWLAGRGYNTCGVKFPAMTTVNRETVHGTFLSVLWENLADPIISGREELGFNKLYCEIAEPRGHDGKSSIRCGWLGHTFFEMDVWDLQEASLAPVNPKNQGILHYKFMPRTGEWGVADFAGAVLSPFSPSDITIKSRQTGQGRFHFRRSEWEDLPTLYHIVNALADIELIEFRSASLTVSEGRTDHFNQRIVGQSDANKATMASVFADVSS